jgi:hypothetical protein
LRSHPPGARCVDCKIDLASGEVDASLDATNSDLLCVPCNKRRLGEICATCDAPLLGEYVTALGGKYCKGCLTCFDCSLDLTSGEAQLTRDAATGDALCVPCNKRRLGEICTTCDEPLLGKYVNVLEGKYHHGCLKCSACAIDMTTRTAHPTRDDATGDVLCTPCDKRRLGEICTTCDEPLIGEYVTALDGKYHRGCLKCSTCGVDLTTDTALPTHDAETGDVLCTPCSKRRLGEICTTCDEPLHGKYVTALDGKYHHGCLKCSTCALDLTTDTAQPTRDAETGDVLCTPCNKRRLGEICTFHYYSTAVDADFDRHHLCPCPISCPHLSPWSRSFISLPSPQALVAMSPSTSKGSLSARLAASTITIA